MKRFAPIMAILLVVSCTTGVSARPSPTVAGFENPAPSVAAPTSEPILTAAPTAVAVLEPTSQPTMTPTLEPTVAPTPVPTLVPVAKVRTLVLPIVFVSQQGEAAPSGWTAWYTPYCVAASSVVVMRYFGVDLPNPPLAVTFATGQMGNTTDDPGIDPDGTSFLMRFYGGEGKVYVLNSKAEALENIAWRLNWGSPVVVFVQAGVHAVVAYGYEADEGGIVTAIYAADPLSGFMGRVPVDAWTNWYMWLGAGFSAPGDKWQGAYVFVSYRDFK